MSKSDEFVEVHGNLIAAMLETRIREVHIRKGAAQEGGWYTIVRACDEEIAELEAVLAELERI